MLGWIMYLVISPITLIARAKRVYDERVFRARAAWLAELDAYREAGWEWDGEAGPHETDIAEAEHR